MTAPTPEQRYPGHPLLADIDRLAAENDILRTFERHYDAERAKVQAVRDECGDNQKWRYLRATDLRARVLAAIGDGDDRG